MKKLILALERELLVAEKQDNTWSVQSFFKGANPVSLAVDPHDGNIIYCATFDRGLWKTYDGGASWETIDIAPRLVSLHSKINPVECIPCFE